jgi:hypothetical protein
LENTVYVSGHMQFLGNMEDYSLLAFRQAC